MESYFLDKRTYVESERLCETKFAENGPFWHLTTPGSNQEIIFTNNEELQQGITFAAVCAATLNIRIIAFELMSNHIHFILAGSKEAGLEFFNQFKSRLKRYFALEHRFLTMRHFNVNDGLIPIADLSMLRNEIVYVHRNQYVINTMITPYSDLYGTGYLYFCPLGFELSGEQFNSMTVRRKKALLKGRAITLPDSYYCRDGYIQPASFCFIREGEQYFRNAHHYFTSLLKSYEAYSETAKRLGDTVSITDDEMYFAVSAMCSKDYNTSVPYTLPVKDKMDVARKMKSDYSASPQQIKRILKLDNSVISELFPRTV